MKWGWSAALAALLIAGAANAQMQVQPQLQQAQRIGTQSSCGVLANHTYAVQMRGQIGDSAADYVMTGIWIFRGDGTGTANEIVAGPPGSGGARQYDFTCGAGAGTTIGSMMPLTLGAGARTTPNISGIFHAAIAGGGARFAIMNSGQNNMRVSGWGERQ